MRYYKNSNFYFSGPSSFMETYFTTKGNFFYREHSAGFYGKGRAVIN